MNTAAQRPWTGHWLDNPNLNPDTLDEHDRKAYWARKQKAIVLATTVSEEVALTAKAAERIRNNRRITRAKLGMPQAQPVVEVSRQQAGLQLLDTGLASEPVADTTPQLILPEGLIGVDETATIDPAAWAELADKTVIEALPAEPQEATLDAILAIEPEEGELSDREILMGLRAKGADVKIKGKSPPPKVTRQPVFNPLDALRAQHALFNATRMNPLAHACKIGVVCLMTGLMPPSMLHAPASLTP